MKKAQPIEVTDAMRAVFPLLSALIDEGTVWTEEGYFVGRASDGVVVLLGEYEKDVEGYLREYPSPERW